VTLERDRFLEGMSRSVTGVTVVTTNGESGLFGQTVSAMSSVSADPPMLLVCINRRSPIHKAIVQHRVFAVNVLRADQRRIAEVFSGRPRSGSAYDFTVARWDQGETTSPMLTGAVAAFDCALEQSFVAGSHEVFLGRVVGATNGTGSPLLYARRSYGELHAFPNQIAPGEVIFPDMSDEDDVDLREM
jgi:flavin reductase